MSQEREPAQRDSLNSAEAIKEIGRKVSKIAADLLSDNPNVSYAATQLPLIASELKRCAPARKHGDISKIPKNIAPGADQGVSREIKRDQIELDI